MRKMAAVLVLAGCAVAAGPASAHDHGGDVVGALVGGALIGAAVGAVLNSAPAVVYPAQPAYAPPQSQNWYYCDKPHGYYPYVQSCDSGWRPVPATPPQTR